MPRKCAHGRQNGLHAAALQNVVVVGDVDGQITEGHVGGGQQVLKVKHHKCIGSSDHKSVEADDLLRHMASIGRAKEAWIRLIGRWLSTPAPYPSYISSCPYLGICGRSRCESCDLGCWGLKGRTRECKGGLHTSMDRLHRMPRSGYRSIPAAHVGKHAPPYPV